MSPSSAVMRRREAVKYPPREMEFQKIAIKAAPENDAVIRFYAMLNMMVTFKGRPMYHIDDKILELRVKQPLVSAFYKMFQAMVNYPNTRSLHDLVQFTCHDVLYKEIDKLKSELGMRSAGTLHLQHDKDGKEVSTSYQRKARECQMKIHEDTIIKFYRMLEVYTPFKMRPRLWDEQRLTDGYWNEKIKAPIREAFKTFITVMRRFPTKLKMQQLLVDYTMDTILPNCETGMMFRGIRYELTLGKDRRKTKAGKGSVWDPRDDNMKIALGYQSEALRHPACSDESKLADERYAAVVRKASIRLEEIECGHQEAGSHAYCELRDSTSLLQRLAKEIDQEKGEEKAKLTGSSRLRSGRDAKVRRAVSDRASSAGSTHRLGPAQGRHGNGRPQTERWSQSKDEIYPLMRVSSPDSCQTFHSADRDAEQLAQYQVQRVTLGFPMISRCKRQIKGALVWRLKSPVLDMARGAIGKTERKAVITHNDLEPEIYSDLCIDDLYMK